MKITIVIEDKDLELVIQHSKAQGCGSRVRKVKDMPEMQALAAEAARPAESELPADLLKDQELAKQLLTELKVTRSDKLLRSYLPGRIIEVCQAAIRKRDKLKNPAGYVLQCLSKGWAV